MKRGGLFALLVVILLAGGYAAASRLGYLERLQQRLVPKPQASLRPSPGDFPAGVSAPVGELAALPLRPTRIGFTPRGSSAALLLATGGASVEGQPPPADEGLLKSAYALSAQAWVFADEEGLRQALSRGTDQGGVDMAVLSVDRLAQWAVSLRDAAPRVVLLLERSQGQEALAAVGLSSLAELKGKKVAVSTRSASWFYFLWLLARSGLSLEDVRVLELKSALEAGGALREGRVDAAVGMRGDVELAAKDRQGSLLSTTADAPHLIAHVLVVRGDFAARHPDAVRRVIRGLLEAAALVGEDSQGARLLGEVAPSLGDPSEALRAAPPATLSDNLRFFGLSGEAPVTYDELFESAAALFVKMKRTERPPPAEDTRDLGPLKYVSEVRKP